MSLAGLKKIKFVRQLYTSVMALLVVVSNVWLRFFVKIPLGRFLLRLFDKQDQLEYGRLLCGNEIYKKNTKKKSNEYYLRRQLHRIEKGLLNENKRAEFGLDYILNAVEIFENILSQGANRNFINYGYRVLADYFAHTQSSNIDYCLAKLKFEKFKKNNLSSRLIQNYKNTHSGLSSFAKLVKSRKSVRHFKDKAVHNKVIENAITLAGYSPTGCNRQPFRFIVIKDEALVKEFSKLPPGGEGNAFGAPVLVFVIGDFSAFPDTSSSHEAYVDAALASMTLVYEFENNGVSTCFMNWPHNYKLNKKAFKRLNLKQYEIIVTSIAVGYAADNAVYACSKRRDVKEILTYL